MPVFPPAVASTMASSVVGIFTKSIPLLYSEAMKPPISDITPPPKLISSAFLSISHSNSCCHTFSQVVKFLLASPEIISTTLAFANVSVALINSGRQCALVFSSTSIIHCEYFSKEKRAVISFKLLMKDMGAEASFIH